MKSSLKRTLALTIFLLLIWGGWYGWQSWKTQQAINALSQVIRSTDINDLLSNPPEEVKNSVDLAVRGIKLSQGSFGRKSFDLNADWATLNQDSGAITVRDPDIHYTMENPENNNSQIVHATSDLGRVEDGNQKISMTGQVRATYNENILTGDTAIFLNNQRTLTFPDGAVLDGPSLSGTATYMVWDLNTNILTGEQGVFMRWTPEQTSLQDSEDASLLSVVKQSEDTLRP
jgi:hypothetical protein